MASSLPEVSQKKKNDLILLIASGPLVRSFRFSGVALENGEKMMKEKIHTVFTQPKEQPWLHCLQPPVSSHSRTSVSVILDVPEATIHTPPKHTVPPRNKAFS